MVLQSPRQQPDTAEAFYKQGLQQFSSGDRAAAAISLRQAYELRPGSPVICNAYGHALYHTGAKEEGEKLYRRAVKLDPNLQLGWQNIGVARSEAGDPAGACEALARAIPLDPSAITPIVFFMDAFSQVRFSVFSDWIKNVLIMCLKSDAVDHRVISTSWPLYFEIDPSFESVRSLKFNLRDLNDQFLKLALRKIRISSMNFEKQMTALRKFFLENPPEEDSFVADLAMQCWINEHIYAVTDEEKKALRALKAKIEKKIQDTPEYIASICVYACYAPLLTLENAKDIYDTLKNSGSPVFQNLLKFYVADPMKEEALKKTIPSQAAISDEISKKVRAQYEESPYPRWKRMLDNRKPKDDAIDILVAGCGTGSHTAQTAGYYPNAKIHNIDLSLSSLAYAVRQTEESGIKNVTFEHADILKFKTDKKFDRIESIGVLHHMEKPEEGLKALTKLLKPDGEMEIGLYSEIARRDIVAARNYIASKKYGSTPDDIRKVRMEIADHPDPLIADCSRRYDFFTMSSCRDLILHEQEHRFTIPQIEKMLKDNGLVFTGFSLHRPKLTQMFKTRFPAKDAEKDLGNWIKIEEEITSFFSGMYIFTARIIS